MAHHPTELPPLPPSRSSPLSSVPSNVSSVHAQPRSPSIHSVHTVQPPMFAPQANYPPMPPPPIFTPPLPSRRTPPEGYVPNTPPPRGQHWEYIYSYDQYGIPTTMRHAVRNPRVSVRSSGRMDTRGPSYGHETSSSMSVDTPPLPTPPPAASVPSPRVYENPTGGWTEKDNEMARMREALAEMNDLIEQQDQRIREEQKLRRRAEMKVKQSPVVTGKPAARTPPASIVEESDSEEEEERPRRLGGRGIKERQPDTFNGDEDKYNEWRTHMRNYLSSARSQAEAIRVLFSYLVGDKMVNFTDRMTRKHQNARGQWTCTYEQVWTELDMSYSDMLEVERSRIEVYNFKQGSLKMKDYISQFEVKACRAKFSLDEPLTLQLLQGGVNKKLRDRMVDGSAYPTTFTGWKERLITYELRLAAIELDQQRSTPAATTTTKRKIMQNDSGDGPPPNCWRCGGERGTKPKTGCVQPWWHRYREPSTGTNMSKTVMSFEEAQKKGVCAYCGGERAAPQNGCQRRYHEARARITIMEGSDEEEADGNYTSARATIEKKLEELRILQARINKTVGKVEEKEATKQGFVDGQ